MIGHWTENDDAVDAYVRDELSPEERKRLQSHLDLCDTCRRRVAEEERIARAVQAHGRSALRRELNDLLSQRTGRRTQTLGWIAAAAVLILAISIWQSPWADDESGRTPEFAEHDSSGVRDEREAKSVPAETRASGQGLADRPAAVAESRVPSEFRTDAGAEAMAGRPVPSEAPSDLQMEFGGAEESLQPIDSWTAGTMQEVQDQEKTAGEVGKRSERSGIQPLREATGDKDRRDVTEDPGLGKLVVTQMQPDDVPPNIQNQTVMQAKGNIPVRIRLANESTIVTLYTNNRWSEDDLKNAVPSAVGDSVQLQLGNQLIRFDARTLQKAKQSRAQ